MTRNESSKKTNLFIILGSIFLTNAILAEIIGVKIFSAERTFGFEPVNWKFFGEYILDFNLTAGAVIWPIVFVTTDIINEYFGKKGVRKISFLTAGLIAYVFVVISVVTILVPADFWLDVNAQTPSGDSFDISYAFNTIFRQGLGIIIGSLTAFLLGQLVDVFCIPKTTSRHRIKNDLVACHRLHLGQSVFRFICGLGNSILHLRKLGTKPSDRSGNHQLCLQIFSCNSTYSPALSWTWADRSLSGKRLGRKNDERSLLR